MARHGCGRGDMTALPARWSAGLVMAHGSLSDPEEYVTERALGRDAVPGGIAHPSAGVWCYGQPTGPGLPAGPWCCYGSGARRVGRLPRGSRYFVTQSLSGSPVSR